MRPRRRQQYQVNSAVGWRAGLHIQLAYGYATDASSTLSAVPFEEDDRDPRTWFLDHNFIEDMTTMFKKVNGAVSRPW